MIHISFVAAPSFEIAFLNELEVRIEHQETIYLNNIGELEVLLKVYDVAKQQLDSLKVEDTINCWEIRGSLSELTQDDFDKFYEHWLKITKRDNNMDEYGQLIFFNSFICKFK